jgi:hypothetical protein
LIIEIGSKSSVFFLIVNALPCFFVKKQCYGHDFFMFGVLILGFSYQKRVVKKKSSSGEAR